ncbi:hypothetical protein ACR3IL_10605 [Streptococcus iniae]|nr:hypothetical protein BKX95_11540 [Streptococcus iniae]
MATLQVVPVEAKEVIGKRLFVSPKFEERTPTRENAEPYREFEVTGDIQSCVTVRVYGLANSDIPKNIKKPQLCDIADSKLVVGRGMNRGKVKADIYIEAKSLRLV